MLVNDSLGSFLSRSFRTRSLLTHIDLHIDSHIDSHIDLHIVSHIDSHIDSHRRAQRPARGRTLGKLAHAPHQKTFVQEGADPAFLKTQQHNHRTTHMHPNHAAKATRKSLHKTHLGCAIQNSMHGEHSSGRLNKPQTFSMESAQHQPLLIASQNKLN